MNFFQDVTQVTFAGIDKVFNVSSVFCEFSIGGNDFSIKWYGIIIALGFMLALIYGYKNANTSNYKGASTLVNLTEEEKAEIFSY